MQSLTRHARAYPRRSADRGHDLTRHRAGQSPEALFITCSDSRVVPALITGAEPGQLFELRTAGNIVPAYNTGTPSGERATIEYAVSILRVPDIIVCGHSHCGAVKALVRSEDLSSAPAVHSWLQHAAPPARHLAPLPDAEADDLALPVQRNIDAQLERLRGYPGVARRLAEGTLNLHAWFYEVHTGAVLLGSERGYLPL
ncbi:carbonic anhydrase [Kitasatospora cineracea]|uniref:Carbonic anhydrase n=1 Tax=Kitasatospora cineracea TaxID=88074 RepID=A0A8G1XBJ4_9ACTN|nr:carbonic anhydrase [Kitasatospora cineracea]ROR43008.1 carbonic anhydrase [Kitasatospora cineracea]